MDPRGAAPAGTALPAADRSSSGVAAASLLTGAEAQQRPSSSSSRPRTPFLAGLLGNVRGARYGSAFAADPEAPQEAVPERAYGSETQSVASNDSATREALKKVRPPLAEAPRCAGNWTDSAKQRAAWHSQPRPAPAPAPPCVPAAR